MKRPARLGPLDLLSLGLLGLRTRPGRALLSALGIAIGIATMIVVTGVPASSQAALLTELTALGTNTLQAAQSPDADEDVRLPESAVRMVQRIGPVTAASAVANTHTLVRRNDRMDPQDGAGITVLATRLDLLPTIDARIRTGRWLTAATAAFPTVVLGSVAATRLGITSLAGDRAAPQVVIADTKFVVAVSRPSDALAAKRATQSSFSVLFLALAAVALVVGGIGVANTMVVAVLERRAEVGLRRALGATRGQIRSQFLTESVLLALLGGLLGTGLGLLATVGYAAWQQWPLVIPAQAALAGVGGAVVIGVLAGVYPSVRAARLPPTRALAAG